jgi:SAM-dependent methyltransferase
MLTNSSTHRKVPGYGEDLAYIHDAGFSHFAQAAAPGLLRILELHGVREGLIVDLGCGSGRWTKDLTGAGYEVLGIDRSPAMIKLARKIAPAARFKVASLFQFEFPPCQGVTAIGECFNYCFDNANSRGALVRVFKRINRALSPGGVLVFDVAGPDRLPKRGTRMRWSAGKDWAVMSATGFERRDVLCRRIVCFRRHGRLYRRTEEVHYLRIYRPHELREDLVHCGFEVCILNAYGGYRLPRGIAGIVATKPQRF